LCFLNDFLHSSQTLTLFFFCKAFGYGAEVPRTRNVSHCFPLTLDDENVCCFATWLTSLFTSALLVMRKQPETKGVEGLLNCYKASLQKVKLRGPTHFAQIIDKAANYAANCPSGRQAYLVLLILTDGTASPLFFWYPNSFLAF